MYDMVVFILFKIFNFLFELLGLMWFFVLWLFCFYLCGEYFDMLCFVFVFVVGNLFM